MEQEYLHLESYKIPVEAVSLQQMILLPDEQAGKYYLENIFPKFCGGIILTADKKYPKEPLLNSRVFKALEEDSSISLFVFGFDSLKNLEINTERIYVVDDVLLNSSLIWDDHKIFELPMDEYRIVLLIMSFFRQWKRISRLGNYSPYYKNFRGYDRKKLSNLFNLVIESS